jgi:hypothetical protein
VRVKTKVKEAKQPEQTRAKGRLREVVEVIPTTSDEAPREADNLARTTAIASERTLRKIWDTPEEDEAWQHL